MEKKSNNFSMQEAMQLANTPLGQQLISQLQKSDPEAIKKGYDGLKYEEVEYDMDGM